MSEATPQTIRIARGEPVNVQLGPLSINVCRSEVGDDGGHTIEVCGEKNEGDEKAPGLIRFDAFRKDPHFHVPSSEPKPTSIGGDYPGGGLAYALEAIRERLPALLDEAGHAEYARQAESLELAAVAEQVRAAIERAPEPTESNEFELTPQVRTALGMDD